MTKANPPKHIVLYADDDEDDLMFIEEAFQTYASNVELVTTFDGSEALTYLNNLSPLDPAPCLIILDINMPKLNGKETLKKIRYHERFAEIPVVIFTTSSMPLDEHFAKKYKAGFITKPLDIRQMKRITETFIEHCTEDIKKKIVKKLS